MTRYRRKFHRIAQRLTNLDLQSDPSDGLSIKDITEDLHGSRGSELFLGRYSVGGIKRALDQFSLLRKLKNRGFENLKFRLDTSDTYRQTMRVYYESQEPSHLLCELVIHKARFIDSKVTCIPHRHFPLQMLGIEWLVLQNPTKTFSDERPPLPGQAHPGLGVGEFVLELLYLTAKHLKTQGLLIVPHYYHTALIFSREFRFIKPGYQALLNKMEHDLRQYSLAARSWGVELGAVFQKYDNKVFQWEPEEQILTYDQNIKTHLYSEQYTEQVREAERKLSFYLDTKILQDKLPPTINLEL